MELLYALFLPYSTKTRLFLRKDWLKTQDPDQQGGSDASVTPTPR